jgi:acyl-CoA thioester hydrolase
MHAAHWLAKAARRAIGCDAMTTPATLRLHVETVRPEWIDYNGHMNVAYYVLAFDHATDMLFDHLAVGESYRRTSGCSFFAVRQRIDYLREVSSGDRLTFETQFLGFDDKRMHFHHRMFHAEQGFLAATTELLALHVDLAARRAAPIAPDARARIEVLARLHAMLPEPPGVGEGIGLPGR